MEVQAYIDAQTKSETAKVGSEQDAIDTVPANCNHTSAASIVAIRCEAAAEPLQSERKAKVK